MDAAKTASDDAADDGCLGCHATAVTKSCHLSRPVALSAPSLRMDAQHLRRQMAKKAEYEDAMKANTAGQAAMPPSSVDALKAQLVKAETAQADAP